MPLAHRPRRRAVKKRRVAERAHLPPEEETPAAALSCQIAVLRDMLERNSDWIWEVDALGRYTYASRHCLTLLGREPADVIGRTPFDFMPTDEAQRVGRIFGEIVADRRPFSQLINRNLRGDGTIVVLETSGVPLLDADGELLGYRGIDRDVSDREAEIERLRYLARHDGLTGLPNRMFLHEELSGRLERSRAAPIAVLAIDLDLFKPINDRLGHAAGDAVLQEVGRRLTALAATHRAFASRLGGDEFVLVVKAGERDAALLADATRIAIGAPIALCAEIVKVVASVGMATSAHHGSTVEGLLAQADADLYRVKAARPAEQGSR